MSLVVRDVLLAVILHLGTLLAFLILLDVNHVYLGLRVAVPMAFPGQNLLGYQMFTTHNVLLVQVRQNAPLPLQHHRVQYVHSLPYLVLAYREPQAVTLMVTFHMAILVKKLFQFQPHALRPHHHHLARHARHALHLDLKVSLAYPELLVATQTVI